MRRLADVVDLVIAIRLARTVNARRVEVDGQRLNVATRDGEGTPLLLATGIGAQHRDVGAVRAPRSNGRPLIAFDAPGTGRSRGRVRVRMRALARLVSRLLDVLGHERVDALGYSFGGALVQELAHRDPERVRRLVLCATSPGLGSVPPKPVAGLLLADARALLPPGAVPADGAAHRGREDAPRSVTAGRAGRRAAGARPEPARLRVPALRDDGLEQPSVAAPPARARRWSSPATTTR